MISTFNAEQYLLLNWFMFGLGCCITILRLGVRYHKERRFLWDDYCAISGFFFLFLMALFNHLSRDGLYLTISLYKGEVPENPMPLQDMLKTMSIARQYNFWFTLVFVVSLWSIKACLMMFYRRLMKCVNGYMVWWWAVVGFCIVTFMLFILLNFLYCLPLHRRFSVDPASNCPIRPARYALFITTAIDISSDILIMVLPIGLLVGLRISRVQKVGVGAIFSLGIIVIIFAIIRFVEVYKAFSTGSPQAIVSLSVVVGSLPALKPLISRKGDTTRYGSGASRSETGGTERRGKILPKPRPDDHIHLSDVPKGLTNSIRGGYESSEALHVPGGQLNDNAIEVAYEISISSRNTTGSPSPR